MNLNPAVPSVGKPVLVVRDGLVIGRGTPVARRGDDFVSIRFDSGAIVDQVQNLELVQAVGLRHSMFRYGPGGGGYLGDDAQTGQGGDELLSDTYVVDEFNLRFGLVPEHFSVVPGYRSALLAD